MEENVGESEQSAFVPLCLCAFVPRSDLDFLGLSENGI